MSTLAFLDSLTTGQYFFYGTVIPLTIGWVAFEFVRKALRTRRSRHAAWVEAAVRRDRLRSRRRSSWRQYPTTH